MRGVPAYLALVAAMLVSACMEEPRVDFADYVQSLRSAGKLRTDTAPPDAPFTDADLERNFIKIAMFNEFAPTYEVKLQRTPSVLNRWEGPVRYHIFGEDVTEDDRRDIAAFMARLARLTGLEITEAEKDHNLLIAVLNADERRAFKTVLEEKWGRDASTFMRTWADDPRSPCVAQYGDSDSGDVTAIDGGIVAVKAEIRGLFRVSCFHEELAQVMGLQNDDDTVRPSIFNDDEEFALMTLHDEYLMRILYDRRLRPGMTAKEVEPLLPEIVRDLDLGEGACCS